jgi:hypothetical protein
MKFTDLQPQFLRHERRDGRDGREYWVPVPPSKAQK